MHTNALLEFEGVQIVEVLNKKSPVIIVHGIHKPCIAITHVCKLVQHVEIHIHVHLVYAHTHTYIIDGTIGAPK